MPPHPHPPTLPPSSADSHHPLSLLPPYYDPELFTTPPPDHLLCAICTGVVHSPLNLSCSHLFCASCLAQWCQAQAQTQAGGEAAAAAGVGAGGMLTHPSSSSSSAGQSQLPPSPSHPSSSSPSSSPTPAHVTHACPTCRAPFSLFLASPNHAIQHVIANMEVRCPNHDSGCPATLLMGLRERNVVAHRRTCAWEKVRCRYAPECRRVGERRDMERHERGECGERMRECEECGELVKCGEWETHRASPLGCVGLMLCPHRCRTEVAGGGTRGGEEEDVAMEGAARKKSRTAGVDDEQHGKEEEHKMAVQAFHSSASTTPSSTPPASSSPKASPPRSLQLEVSAPPSPTPQLFVSVKRKFGIMTNPAHLSAAPAPPSSSASSSSASSSSSNFTPPSFSSSPFTVIRRSTLAAHLSVCPLRPVQCDLCPARVLRSEVEAHFQANLASHLMALQRSHRSEALKGDLLLSELGKLRQENADMRREVAELTRQVCSPPLFAFFFDIAPLSLLCSHYVSNDFVCGDHSYYFALHRQANCFSAFIYLKTGNTPVRLSYVLMVKQRKQLHRTNASSPAPHSPPEQRVEGEVDGLLEQHDAAALGAGQQQPPLSLSPVTSLVSSSVSSAFSSPSDSPFSPSPVSLRVKLDVEYKAAEGKGIANWFTLADLTERDGYSVDEDAITIGVLIKDHSSAWVYSAADALYPPLPAASSRAPGAAHSGLDLL